MQSGQASEIQSVSEDLTRRTEIESVTSIGDCSDMFDADPQLIESSRNEVSRNMLCLQDCNVLIIIYVRMKSTIIKKSYFMIKYFSNPQMVDHFPQKHPQNS